MNLKKDLARVVRNALPEVPTQQAKIIAGTYYSFDREGWEAAKHIDEEWDRSIAQKSEGMGWLGTALIRMTTPKKFE